MARERRTNSKTQRVFVIDELSDFDMPINVLITRLQTIAAEYGVDSRLKTDAGHNNVELVLTVRRPK